LELDEHVVFDGDLGRDQLDRGLELRNMVHEFLSKLARVRTGFANLLCECIKLFLKGVDLSLELPILSCDFCLLSSDFGSQGFLGESNLTNGSVESEDGALDFSLGGLESFEVGEPGGDLDGPLVDHEVE